MPLKKTKKHHGNINSYAFLDRFPFPVSVTEVTVQSLVGPLTTGKNIQPAADKWKHIVTGKDKKMALCESYSMLYH